jgi:hypothetical protein
MEALCGAAIASVLVVFLARRPSLPWIGSRLSSASRKDSDELNQSELQRRNNSFSGGSESRLGEIRQAVIESLADGVRQHLPTAIGILATGLSGMALATIGHFVLGADGWVVDGAAGPPVLYAVYKTLLMRRQGEVASRDQFRGPPPTTFH